MHYFGCVGEVGHYHFVPSDGGRPVKAGYYDAPFFPHCDGAFCPTHTQKEGVVQLTHHRDDWTILAFWDRSVDKRAGSHSTFMIQEKLNKDEMIIRAKEAFPTIWARYCFEVQ
jgi:hypothetical protein